ncbi:MAG: non-homologous end-joining DNA ligase [Kofleriaceae bacterium]|nr:non-homologous end-joining DNA ligase [Kofleriaceae bacterium]
MVEGTKRKKRRKYGKHDSVPVRRYELAPIVDGDVCPADPVLEPAWDGHRVLVMRHNAHIRLHALDGRDWSTTFPAVTRALGKLAAAQFVLDGVVCVIGANGTPSFEALREGVSAGKAVGSAVLVCWDVLAIDDEDVRGEPLHARRARLRALLAEAAPALVLSQTLEGSLERVLAAVAPLGIASVVARSADGAYTTTWSTHGAPVDWQRSLSAPPPLTNADKVLYPRDGHCKRDIVGYYRAIAPVLVPHLVDRPVVIQRWPDGIDEQHWYQHRMPPRAPDYLRAAYVDGVRRIILESADALLWMANQAGLTFHAFGSRLATLSEPDYAMLDLDPGERTTWWAELVEIALAIRKLLELLELPSVVKTSGQRGLHVLIPLARGHTFAEAEELARGIGRMLERLHPTKVSLETEREKRRGRLLVDHKQFLAKTLVAPYSLRGVDGAPVSTPLAWDEVTPTLDPRAFTLRTVRARLDASGDLAARLFVGGADIGPALARLREV